MAKIARDWGPTLAIAIPAAMAAAIGGSSLVGWIVGHPPAFTTVHGATPVAAGTALGLLAAGTAVAASLSATRIAHVLRYAASVLLLLLGTLALVQLTTGLNLGIDFPAMHAIADWEDAPPGRISLPTATALLLTGLLLACHDRVDNRAGALAMQLGAGALLALGVSSLVAYDVRPEGVFPIYRYSRMAPATAAAVLALGIAFLAIIARAPWYEQVYRRRADERILILAIGILTLVLVGVGAAALAVLQRHMEANVGAALNNAIDNRVTILESVFANRLTRASIVGSRPGTQERLAQWQGAGTPALRRQLTEDAATYLSAGFRGLAFNDEHGRPLIEVGKLAAEPTLEVPILAQRMQATLLWEEPQFVLRSSSPVLRNGVRVGSVVTEQVLEVLPELHFEVNHLGQTAEWVMCADLGETMGCFPQRFLRYSRVFARHQELRALPMDRALDGKRGVSTTRDYRNEAVIAAYAPVGATGLGLVIKIETEEYYRPLVTQLLQWGQWFFAMALIGALLLASQVRPVAQRLVQSEELARIRADALARRERDLAALYASLGDGVMVFTPEGTIEFANPAAERIFGFPPGALAGKPVSVLVPEGMREANERASERFAATGESGLLGRRGMVFPALRRDGSKIQIEFSLSEMQQESGRRLVGVVRDVTAREALDRMKSEFVAAVSHELRTPLTSIIASLELAAEDGLPEPQRGMLDMARRNASRLAKLVDDVIDSTLLDSGSLRFEPARFSLGAAVAEAAASTRAMPTPRGDAANRRRLGRR
jgi:PAS domain S-box-containing protein